MGKLTYGSSGMSYQVSATKFNVGGSPVCPRCSQKVYFNEEKKAVGKSWHKKCFTCATCRKSLDSTTNAPHQGEVYCVTCHKRQFGPKGYGFAGGMAGLSTESSAENVRPVDQPQTQHVPIVNSPKQQQQRDKNHPENCPRCGTRVYFAEEVKAMGRKWHKLCFKCADCKKIMEPGRCNVHDNEVYCRACYGRSYGPKGYGFAGGAGNLLSSEYIEETNGVHSARNVTSPIKGSHQWTEPVYI